MSIDVHKPDRIEMSQRERDVLKIMHPVLPGQRTQAEAARLLGLSVRQVRRIQRKLQAGGDAGIIHGLRGRPSNHQPDADFKRQVLTAYRQHYPDFGPTFTSEKLAQDGLAVCPQTLRRWLIAEGLWTRKRRRNPHRSGRPRRDCLGELVQMDAGIHDWLEGRGEEEEADQQDRRRHQLRDGPLLPPRHRGSPHGSFGPLAVSLGAAGVAVHRPAQHLRAAGQGASLA